jgi:hypothetical protein
MNWQTWRYKHGISNNEIANATLKEKHHGVGLPQLVP